MWHARLATRSRRGQAPSPADAAAELKATAAGPVKPVSEISSHLVAGRRCTAQCPVRRRIWQLQDKLDLQPSLITEIPSRWQERWCLDAITVTKPVAESLKPATFTKRQWVQ